MLYGVHPAASFAFPISSPVACSQRGHSCSPVLFPKPLPRSQSHTQLASLSSLSSHKEHMETLLSVENTHYDVETSLKTAPQACYFYSWNKQSNKTTKNPITLSYVGKVTGILHKGNYTSLRRGWVNFILTFWLSIALGFARLFF